MTSSVGTKKAHQPLRNQIRKRHCSPQVTEEQKVKRLMETKKKRMRVTAKFDGDSLNIKWC